MAAKHLACKYQKPSIPKFWELHWRQHTLKNPVFIVAAKDLWQRQQKTYWKFTVASHLARITISVITLAATHWGSMGRQCICVPCHPNTLLPHATPNIQHAHTKRKTLTLLQIEIKKEKWPRAICSKVRVPSLNSCSLCCPPALPNLEGAAHCVPWWTPVVQQLWLNATNTCGAGCRQCEECQVLACYAIIVSMLSFVYLH